MSTVTNNTTTYECLAVNHILIYYYLLFLNIACLIKYDQLHKYRKLLVFNCTALHQKHRFILFYLKTLPELENNYIFSSPVAIKFFSISFIGSYIVIIYTYSIGRNPCIICYCRNIFLPTHLS